MIRRLASTSLFRFLPVKEISLEIALEKQHLNDRDVPVSLQRLLNVPQQMLLVHAGRSMDMCVHLSKAHVILFLTGLPLFHQCQIEKRQQQDSFGAVAVVSLMALLSIKRLVASPCAHCRNPGETQPSVRQVRGSHSGDCEADTWFTRSVFGRLKVFCCF